MNERRKTIRWVFRGNVVLLLAILATSPPLSRNVYQIEREPGSDEVATGLLLPDTPWNRIRGIVLLPILRCAGIHVVWGQMEEE